MPRATIAVAASVALVAAGGLIFLRPARERPRSPGIPIAAPSSTVAPTPTRAPTATTTSTSTSAPPAATTSTTSPDVGALPQTRDKPSGTDPALAERMRVLVAAVASGDPSGALPAFFPEQAYVQVKAVANPAADWKDRLVAIFDQDIVGLHRSLGATASSISFAGVDVPDANAQWLGPGAEYNKIGYWRVFNTVVRLTTSGGKQSSFVVISMISWRGQWYVVHFRTPPK